MQSKLLKGNSYTFVDCFGHQTLTKIIFIQLISQKTGIKTTRWTGGLNRPYKGLSLVVAPLRGHWTNIQSHILHRKPLFGAILCDSFDCFKLYWFSLGSSISWNLFHLLKYFLLTPSWTGGFFMPIRRHKKTTTPKKELLFFGGKRGIRTLGAFIGHTRFPVVRLRPAQPSFHRCFCLCTPDSQVLLYYSKGNLKCQPFF